MIPKNAAHTGSSENASAVRVALVRRCAHVCARNASALANTPVTTSALHTVQPCGIVKLARGERDDEQPGERAEHLDQRERDRVVARREALHQHDLERVDGRARQHEQVAGERAAVHTGEEREADRRERDAERRPAAEPVAEEQRARAPVSARRTSR